MNRIKQALLAAVTVALTAGASLVGAAPPGVKVTDGTLTNAAGMTTVSYTHLTLPTSDLV